MLALLGGPKVRTAPWPVWPERGAEEEAAVLRVIRSGRWGGYPPPGPETRAFQAAFGAMIGARHVVAAANGTVTLEVALRALGVEAGDEVIVPALTWVATAAAPAYINAVPVLVDVEPDTLCLDPAAVEAAITPRTRAVVPVHLGSAMADMDALMDLAEQHGLRVLEDCAHAHGARWQGRGAGAIGDAGSFSFQSSKLLTAGEGGAITTDDDELAWRCQSLVNCGRKEAPYDGFEGPSFGWNHRLSELQAGLLSAQLARLPDQAARRERNLAHLTALLEEHPELGLVPQRRDPRITRPAAYEVVLLYTAEAFKGLPRDRFVQALEAEGVPADGDFYVPIQDRVQEIFPLTARQYPEIRARYGEALTPESVHTPVARKVAYERTVWLHHGLFLGTTADVEDIVAAMLKIREGVDALL
ncbi:MAG: DegT/DnrJ/EryC1/StrS family aminotransferase [Deltaproteobacteria bacterium]|nr:DegT/DnrJ/EryC1/StrS family aminotransferase [Deltaproteobacteria bacterium]